MKTTDQMETWSDRFGADYTDRNVYTGTEIDEFYQQQYGLNRSDLNERFLADVPKDARILEVGCNVGNQLACLQRAGFTDLTGVELQWYAVERAKDLTRRINILQGDAFDLPFRDDRFDLVFTSGVLIHIAPGDLPDALGEVVRRSKRWVWGFEYYADAHQAIQYRGNRGLMWKGDFKRMYQELDPRLQEIQSEMVPYKDNDNVDEMFLLESKGA